mmetsp:Transcript_66088/g.153497  ORF Transcript_66088/g.153497 Transcript_66088/m.153497 type:complete len:204 (-) Transcript_66088:376-987(-)
MITTWRLDGLNTTTPKHASVTRQSAWPARTRPAGFWHHNGPLLGAMPLAIARVPVQGGRPQIPEHELLWVNWGVRATCHLRRRCPLLHCRGVKVRVVKEDDVHRRKPHEALCCQRAAHANAGLVENLPVAARMGDPGDRTHEGLAHHGLGGAQPKAVSETRSRKSRRFSCSSCSSCPCSSCFSSAWMTAPTREASAIRAAKSG